MGNARISGQEPKGESSLKGHLNGEGAGNEGSGSDAYVPPEAKDDKQRALCVYSVNNRAGKDRDWIKIGSALMGAR